MTTKLSDKLEDTADSQIYWQGKRMRDIQPSAELQFEEKFRNITVNRTTQKFDIEIWDGVEEYKITAFEKKFPMVTIIVLKKINRK